MEVALEWGGGLTTVARSEVKAADLHQNEGENHRPEPYDTVLARCFGTTRRSFFLELGCGSRTRYASGRRHVRFVVSQINPLSFAQSESMTLACNAAAVPQRSRRFEPCHRCHNPRGTNACFVNTYGLQLTNRHNSTAANHCGVSSCVWQLINRQGLPIRPIICLAKSLGCCS